MIGYSNEKSKEALVSVIVPTYNYGHFISETLESCLNQEYSNWECIVVDNGSSDNTKALVSSYTEKDIRFRYLFIVHSTTSVARNAGLLASRGEFIQFLDADDQIEKGKLFNQIELFRNNPSAGLVYSSALFYNDGDQTNKRFTHDDSDIPWIPEFTGKSWGIFSEQFKRNIFVISSPLIKKSSIEKAGGFYEPLNWVEDWEFYLRVLALNELMIYDDSPESTSYIRVHTKSLSRNRLKMYKQSLIARKQLVKLLITLKVKGFPNAQSLIDDNSDYEAFLYRLLYQEVMPLNKLNALMYLYSYARRKKDWKILVKFTLGLLTRRFPVFSTQ
jgi:glycosyltransferase involved in cell wall biosynthesis